ncbi:hypothetical protein SAMN05216588_105264 [Pseudomonas flavescens]|uniref:Methyltransferase domain-containing protein n=1 Tax=Phytopseudomonas flavescens TaxID=29435 RepID=A0A1G8DHN5_9GAMM|nr:class I SAM-dependent methyltransferase [Pseudomonas flavescens]SDH57156.1 hypothetical protein SAMN05216588_105264 [Pseudomonas flavescens]
MKDFQSEFRTSSMFKLAEHFDGLATGRTQTPSRRVCSNFRSSETDPLWRQSHDLIVERSGPLFQHFLASLPCVLEEMCRVNAALERLRRSEVILGGRSGHNFFALDAFDGTQARALSEISGHAFASHTCSPNPGNAPYFHELNTSSAATFDQAPFFTAVDTLLNTPDHNGFDVIYETAAFQFYGPDRKRQIEIAQKVLKQDGILLLLGKTLRSEPERFDKDEARKDELHKAKYFTQEEILWKQQQMLQSMHHGLVPINSLIHEAFIALRNVYVMWNGGNFFELAACRDAGRLRKFVELLGPIRLSEGFVLDRRVGEWISA